MSESIYDAAMRAAEELRQARIAAWVAGCYAASCGLPCMPLYDDEGLNAEYRKGYDAQVRIVEYGKEKTP
ncbi:MAG: hypothetical protein FJZ89_13520 [Chloroflexi bacterium]|nr:hypothetical protein [Chloroflexota bacterium]